MSKDIEFVGLEGIIKSLDKIADVNKVKQAISKACLLVERSAKTKAPKDNGELRRSITHEVETTANNVVGVVYTPLEYAPYVELGTGLFAEEGNGRKDVPWHYKDEQGEWHSTKGQKPHPFLRPALNENKEEIKRELKGALTSD